MNRILRSQLPQVPKDSAAFDTTTVSLSGRTHWSNCFNLWVASIAIFCLSSFGLRAQTTLLSGTSSDGSFEGASLAANGWTTTQSTTNYWTSGTGGGASDGTRSAFVTNDGTINGYNNVGSQANHFWRDFTAPAGETIISLSFFLKGNPQDVGYDRVRVYVAPISSSPTAGTEATTGATQIFTFDGNLATFTQQTASFTTSISGGQSFRVIFTWRNDGSVGSNPPYAVDQVNIVSAAPSTFTTTAAGGLWSNSATWIGGVVPPGGNDVVIPAGSIVTADAVLSYRNVEIGGILQWSGTANAMTLTGDLTVNSGGSLLPYTTAGTTGVNMNIAGNLVNNGYINMAAGASTSGVINFNGSGSTISGTGTFQGDGTNGIIRVLQFANSGTNTINTSQNLVVYDLRHDGGTLNTNGKIILDNTKLAYNLPFNTRVASISVTNMGAGYSAQPMIGPTGTTRWAAAANLSANSVRAWGGNLYIVTGAGVSGTTGPTHTSGTAVDGTATLLWVGTAGCLGNAFILSPVVGTQYFYGDNLYTCTAGGANSALATAPPTHTSGTVASGTAAFKYVGTVAKATANFNAVTGNVRSISISQAGSGYFNATAPAMVIVADQITNPTTSAAATVVVFQSIASPANTVARRSPGTTISGGLTINSDGSASTTSSNNIQALSGVEAVYIAGNPGNYNNTTAPNVGFGLPNNLNLVTNGGSGCTAPLVTVTGGTLISGTAVLPAAFALTWANGSATSVYCATPGTATYSVPPTIAVTGCTTAPTLAWPVNCLPLATAVLDVNGMIKAINVTNKGYGYNAAPTVGLSTPTPGPTVTPTAPTARLGLYNYTIAVNTPTTSASAAVTEDAYIPANRIINTLILGANAAGLTLSNNLTLIGTAPLTLTASTAGNILNLGGFNINTPWNQNGGITGTYNIGGTKAYVVNGSFTMHGRGTNTWDFPFAGQAGNSVRLFTGAANAVSGCTNILTATITQLSAPANTTAGGTGWAIGNRSYKINTTTLGGGVGIGGATATIRLPYNDLDAITTVQSATALAEAPASSGPWNLRSAVVGATAIPLAASGTLTSPTIAPGPVSLANNNVYAFATLFPTITSVAPTVLCANSTSFQIQGTNLIGVTSVTIGGVPVGSFTVVDASTINCFAGAATSGFVSVTNSSGASAISSTSIAVNASPAAPAVSVSASTVTYGNTLNVVATGVGGSFNWYTVPFGGSSISVLPTYSSVVCSTNTVYVAEFDGACEGARTPVVITVANPSILSSTPTFCGAGGTTTLTASNLAAGATTLWTSLTSSASLSSNSGNTTSATLAQTSEFKLTVTTTGCSVYDALISVGVYPLPSATVSASATGVCPGTSATIESGLSAGNFAAVCITPRTQLSTPPANAITLCNAGTATTALTGGGLDDGYWNNRPIGFNFNYFGVSQTNVMIGTNGTIILGGGANAQYNFAGGFPSTGNPANCIAACARDLQLSSFGGANGFGGGKVSYWTEGVAPNRRFVVQYANCATWYSTNSTDGRSSVEVVLYETLGSVEIYVIEASNPAATIGSFINETRNKFIGLQDGTRTVGATAPNCSAPFGVNYWNGVADQITSPLAWRFSPPDNYITIWTATDLNGTYSLNQTPTQNNGNGSYALTLPVVGGPYTQVNSLNGFTANVSPLVTTNYSILYASQLTGCDNSTSPAQATMAVLSAVAPTGVSALANATIVCPADNIALSSSYTGSTSGLTFQWQVSTNGGTVWNDILGATSSTFSTSQSIASAYRLGIASCGGTIAYSSSVSVALTSYLECYCASYATDVDDEEISNVTIGTALNNSSTCSTLAPGPGSLLNGYSNYTTLPATNLIQGEAYPISVTQTSCGAGVWTNIIGAWIDYNHNGLFTDPGEQVLTANYANGNQTATGTFTVPTTSLGGLTRMRVVVDEDISVSPCGTYLWGETEDYNIYILGPCTPLTFAPPTVVSGELDATVCGSQTTSLSANDINSISAPIYLWYDAAVGGNLLQNSSNNTYATSAISSSTSFYVAVNTGTCITSRSAYTLNWVASPAITVSNSNPLSCGSTSSPTNLGVASSNPLYTYTWSASPSVGSGLVSGTTGSTVSAVSPTVNNVYVYTVTGVDNTGCSATSSTTVSFYAPLTGTATIIQPAFCGVNGAVNFSVNGAGTVFTSDFSSATLNPAQAELCNNAIIINGQLQLTGAINQQKGGLLISNSTGIATNDFQIDFDMITTAGSNPPADGFSYSYGPDVVCMPNSIIAGDNVLVAAGAANPENGSGSGIRLSFDAYTNGVNVNGIYLMYNCLRKNPASTLTPSEGLYFYENNTSWIGGVSTHVTIKINGLGQMSMWLAGTQVLNNAQLPSSYLTANKANWKHAFAARTGGLNQGHLIDNLDIHYNNFYEYSVDNGATWSTNSPISVSSPSSVQNLARYISLPSCSVNMGTSSVAYPVAAPVGVTGGSTCLNGTTLNVNGFGLPTGGQTSSYLFGSSLSSGVGTAIGSAGIAPSIQGNPITINLPAGAIVTSAQLVLTNVTGAYLDELLVALSGAVTLESTVVFPSGGASGSTGTITLSPALISNGVVNVLLGESWDDSGTDATAADISLNLVYSIAGPPSWFSNAVASTGSFVGVGTTFNVVGTPILPSTATAVSSTAYAANIETFGTSTCYSSTVPVAVSAGLPLVVTVAATAPLTSTTTLNSSQLSIIDGVSAVVVGSVTIPVGATVLSTQLRINGVTSTSTSFWEAYGTDIDVSMSGASTKSTSPLSNTFETLNGSGPYTFTASPITSGGGTVVVTISNYNGWGALVTINQVQLIVTYLAPLTGNVCPGTPVTLVASSTGGGFNPTYQWNLNGSPIVGANSSTYIATPLSSTDTYTATIVDNCNPAGSTSSGFSVQLFNVTAGTITGPGSILVNDFTAPVPGSGSYNIAGQNSGSTIQWSFGTVSTGPYSAISGAVNATQTLTPNGAAGIVFLTATTTTTDGCSIQANVLPVVLGNTIDTPCTAAPITLGNQGGIEWSNAAASQQTDETYGAGFANPGNTIWFSFVAPPSGHVSIVSTSSTDWDNQMTLFSGSNCANPAAMTQLGYNDDSANSLQAALMDVSCLIPGTTYYIQLRGYGNGIGQGGIVLTNLGNVAPAIAGISSNITASAAIGTCAAIVTWIAPTASDDQGCVTLSSNFNSGASFPVGVTTVTYTATDAQGLVTTASFTVTVNDTQLPTVTAPAAVTVTAILNSCNAVATLGSVTTADNCGVADLTNNAPATFPIGNTTVTYTVTDVNGNIGTATQTVTVLVNPANIWYADNDGDTYGLSTSTVTACSQPVGYVLNATDCNDASAAVNPAAIEICGNAIDDNCSGLAEEGCTNPGENPSNATSVITSIWPNCNAVNGTLVNANVSGSAQTFCLTGEDKWHQFVATSEGISIVVNSSAANIVIELQTAAGVLVAQENAVAGLGGEILNHYGLTAGQVYKVGVRNYNSAQGNGTYSICVKMLKRGGCDYGPGPYSLCQYFKATWAGAAGTSYTFTYTGLTGPAAGNVYTRTQNTDICVLSSVLPTLPYGSTYNLLVTNTYTINNGAGVPETIAVPGLAPCSMSTISQPITSLRASDRCTVGPRFRGSVVASLPWVCGVTNWRWEFTELNAQGNPVGLPITVNRGIASNFINLGTISQLQFGKTYSVRTAPILSYTGTNYQWGTTFCLSIVGSAGMIADGSQANDQAVRMESASEVNMSLYPNPTHGTDVNINLSGVDSENVQIRIVDAMGRQVWSNRYSVNGVLNTNITFERPLANGLYFVEAIFNGEVQTQRMMVQK